MKKVPYFLSFVLLLICAFSSFAQHDPKAEKILNEMSKKYKSIKTFKADFSYVMERR
jgi:outer membrane lipoprotein-sorting protein